MSQRKGEGATKKILSPSTLPTSTRKMVVVKSITKEEIDRFWRRKRMVEEEHLLAAQKAAARIRAKALKQEEDFRRFEELLREIIDGEKSEEEGKEGDGGDGNNKELRIGIKDWWTKSKYAYLNQPAIKSIDDHAKNGSNTYLPQKSCFIFNSPALYGNCTAYFGVF